MSKEIRVLSARLQLRQAAGDEGSVFGYAAKFNSLSQPLSAGGLKFREKLAPGCFANSLASGKNIACLYGHDSNRLLGSTVARTLRLREDDIGLNFDCDLPDTSDGDDVRALVKRGDLTGMSFGFSVDDSDDEDWEEEQDDNGDFYACRTVNNCSLFEISLTAFPAYSQTIVSARSMPPTFASRHGGVSQEEEKALWRKHFDLAMTIDTWR